MKVLILAYDFPPLISVGGQRPYSWYKYLPPHGIEVTVITRHWSDTISSPVDYVQPTQKKVVIESDGKGNNIVRVFFSPNLRDQLLISFGFHNMIWLRKLLTFFYSFAEYLSFSFDSKAAIYREAVNRINESKPDFIIATGEPFILFKYASLLSSKFRIPWIADYRDGWTTNQGNYTLGLLQKMLASFYSRREKIYIENCSLITTAAPAYAASLKLLHPDKAVKVIYNGFDEEFFQGIENISPPADKWIISYAGTIYPHQQLEMFLDGFGNFVKGAGISPKQVEVRFYGIESQPEAKARLLNYRAELNGFITCHSKIKYAELVKAMRASHLLLLLSKQDANWLNAKVFDYLGVKRKIFLVQNDKGILEKIIKETASGVALNSSEEVTNFLKNEYALWNNGQEEEITPNPGYLNYTRQKQTSELSALLKSLSSPA